MSGRAKNNFIKICLLMILSVLILSCSNSTSEKKSLVEDPGSPKKVKMLKDRASQFWAAMVKGDLKEAYKYYDPFLRAKMSPEEFIEKHSAVKYHEATVTDVKVEGNIGTVHVQVKYSVPKTKIRQRELSVPETTTDFEERWLFVYDDWYKEYYLKYFDTGVAFY